LLAASPASETICDVGETVLLQATCYQYEVDKSEQRRYQSWEMWCQQYVQQRGAATDNYAYEREELD
jgi:hypothetical protein